MELTERWATTRRWRRGCVEVLRGEGSAPVVGGDLWQRKLRAVLFCCSMEVRVRQTVVAMVRWQRRSVRRCLGENPV
jgi:hypothetical protein